MSHRQRDLSYCPIPVSISTLAQMFVADMKSKKSFLGKVLTWCSQNGSLGRWVLSANKILEWKINFETSLREIYLRILNIYNILFRNGGLHN